MMRQYLTVACAACVMFLCTAGQASAATLTVAWDRSTDSTVTGYIVSYGTAPGSYSRSIVAGNTTSIALTGLADATFYYVIAQSYNSEGVYSERSAEVVAQTGLSAPSISCPAPVVTSFDGQPVSVTLLPVVTGGASPVATQCSPASGSRFPIGTSAYSCSATDAIQRTVSCTSTVVVVKAFAPIPTAPPAPPAPLPPSHGEPLAFTLACPVIPHVTSNHAGGKAIVTFDDPVVGGGTAPVVVSCAPASGSPFSIGTTTVSCRATDALRQIAACTTSATVLAPSR